MNVKNLALMTALLMVVAINASADHLKLGGTGADPILLPSNTSFTVDNVSGGNLAELVLFFSVPTNAVGSFNVASSNPTLTLLHAYSAILTSSGCGDVYTCVGAPSSFNNSNSYTNFTGAAAANSLAIPTSYTIFEYYGPALANGSSLTFSGVNIPAGTFIDGAGFDSVVTTWTSTVNGSLDSKGFTAFTSAGLVVTPEPTSLAMLGMGVLSLLGFRKVRK